MRNVVAFSVDDHLDALRESFAAAVMGGCGRWVSVGAGFFLFKIIKGKLGPGLILQNKCETEALPG